MTMRPLSERSRSDPPERDEARLRIEVLEAALDERDLRLRELDHRVRNQLQLVAGLLHLACARTREVEARRGMEGVLQQVTALAELHACLDSDRTGDVSMCFGAYLERLCALLGLALTEHRHISIAAAADRTIMVEAARAVPLALATSELITNAVKHGFPDGRTGSISVSFERCASGIRLIVADDGCGLPSGSSEPRGGGRGAGLVAALVRQAGGRLAFLPTPLGTACAIELAE